jgi:Flp pilus assembly protein TadG
VIARQDGSVSVVLAAAILMVLMLVLGVTDLARVLAARSVARAAADAAALAAAQELAFTSGLDPAVVAADFSVANGATLVACACAVGSSEAVVEVRVEAVGLFLVPEPVLLTVRARAVVDLPAAA